MINDTAESIQEELRSMIHKTRVYIIGTVLFSLVLILVIIFNYRPTVSFDVKQLNQMENDRVALAAQRVALQNLVDAQAATIAYLSGSDSTLLKRIDINKLAIDKLKTDEIPTNYSTYGSADLTRAFAELER